MTARKWGVPCITCGPHYQIVVYPNDRIQNVRADCCGLDARWAKQEGCGAKRERMEPCCGPENEGCAYDDGSFPHPPHHGDWWVPEQAVRDCEHGERCPLTATLKEAKR